MQNERLNFQMKSLEENVLDLSDIMRNKFQSFSILPD